MQQGRGWLKQLGLGIVLLSLPVLTFSLIQGYYARRRALINAEARTAFQSFQRRMQQIGDLRKQVQVGAAFRWFPMHDVSGRRIPRPGEGKHILVLFGGVSRDLLDMSVWGKLLDQHPQTVLWVVLRIPPDEARHKAPKYQHPRLYLIPDPNDTFHEMFNAVHRVFVVDPAGRIVYEAHLEPKTPPPSMVAQLNRALNKAKGGGG